MILSINIHNERLVCLETTNIRTVNIVNNGVNVSTNSRFGIDDLKIYTDSIDESHQIYDRIVYCINHPVSALNSAKDYLAIGCKDMEEDSDE
jgi:hypothetical protein